MQISKQRLNSTLEKQLFLTLFQLIADLKTPQEVEQVLKDILSDTELTTVAKRLAVAYWLTKGRSYTNIKDNIRVSSASISDVQHALKKPGWKLALQKITADEWATQWEQRINKLLKPSGK